MSNNNIETKILELIAQLDDYLAGRLSHTAIQNHIKQHFEAWDNDKAWHTAPYSQGERAYWCALWTGQHLADEEHWKDGLPQRDFKILIEVLRQRNDLPAGWQGRRPSEFSPTDTETDCKLQ